MKKVFGYILLIVGIISLFRGMASGSYNGGFELLGGFIGISLICFLPAFFLLRNKKQFHEDNENKTE